MALGSVAQPRSLVQPMATAEQSLFPVCSTCNFEAAAFPATANLQVNGPMDLQIPQFQTAIAAEVMPGCLEQFSHSGVFWPVSYYNPGRAHL